MQDLDFDNPNLEVSRTADALRQCERVLDELANPRPPIVAKPLALAKPDLTPPGFNERSLRIAAQPSCKSALDVLRRNSVEADRVTDHESRASTLRMPRQPARTSGECVTGTVNGATSGSVSINTVQRAALQASNQTMESVRLAGLPSALESAVATALTAWQQVGSVPAYLARQAASDQAASGALRRLMNSSQPTLPAWDAHFARAALVSAWLHALESGDAASADSLAASLNPPFQTWSPLEAAFAAIGADRLVAIQRFADEARGESSSNT